MHYLFVLFYAIGADLFRAVTAGESRIIGGEKSPRSYPYQISLQYKNQHNCGGSIVTSNCIVTAAHCAVGFDKASLSIVVGTNQLDGSDGKRYSVEKVTVHPGYQQLVTNDIAVMIINGSFEEGPKVARIKYSDKFVGDGENATLTGWGFTNPYRVGGPPRSLRRIFLQTITNEECRKAGFNITDNEICTNGRFFKGACGGDSGGPLTIGDGEELIGADSYGTKICGIGRPDVFTRISRYSSWITDNCC